MDNIECMPNHTSVLSVIAIDSCRCMINMSHLSKPFNHHQARQIHLLNVCTFRRFDLPFVSSSSLLACAELKYHMQIIIFQQMRRNMFSIIQLKA